MLPGVVGALEAVEAVKLLLGRGETLRGRLLLYDALAATFREVRVRRDPACPTCGSGVEAPDPRRAPEGTGYCAAPAESARSGGETSPPSGGTKA